MQSVVTVTMPTPGEDNSLHPLPFPLSPSPLTSIDVTEDGLGDRGAVLGDCDRTSHHAVFRGGYLEGVLVGHQRRLLLSVPEEHVSHLLGVVYTPSAQHRTVRIQHSAIQRTEQSEYSIVQYRAQNNSAIQSTEQSEYITVKYRAQNTTTTQHRTV